MIESATDGRIFIVDTLTMERAVRVQFAKWGNSLALRIPAVAAKEIGASENGVADLTIEHGKLVIAPVEDIPAFDLGQLVARITDANRHDEVSAGAAVGNEFG